MVVNSDESVGVEDNVDDGARGSGGKDGGGLIDSSWSLCNLESLHSTEISFFGDGDGSSSSSFGSTSW